MGCWNQPVKSNFYAVKTGMDKKFPNNIRIFFFLLASGAVFMAAIYFVLTVQVNRILYYMSIADVKGLVMYLYSAGGWGFAVSIGVAAIQAIAPFLSKAAVISANVVYFGDTIAFLLTVAGFLTGSIYAYTIGLVFGAAVSKIVFFRTECFKRFVSQYGHYITLAFYMLPLPYLGLISYLAGFLIIDFKKFLVVCVLGQIAGYMWLQHVGAF